VKAWWDQDVNWTLELIRDRYNNYVHGYKILHYQGKIIQKPIYGYIINFADHPIGYIQYYNKHDFPSHHEYNASELPKSCAGLDWYIGERDYIGHGIGTKVLSLFIEEYVLPKFRHVFVDPENNNKSAINCYKKAGFLEVKVINDMTWMIKT
jgi:aminoglycoside 6'-N-acetyltransferase